MADATKKPGKTKRPRNYADAAWVTADVIARFGVDEEEAREFLSTYEKWIREAMIRAGWDAIDIFGSEMGWTSRDWEETEDAIDGLA